MVNLTLFAVIPPEYYDDAAGESGAALQSTLHDIIDGHTTISYDAVWNALKNTDEDPNNSSNVILLYTGRSQSKTSNGGDPDEWNREHVWPKSHGVFTENNTPGRDLHNLKPTDVSVNGDRGNLDFDDGGSQHSEATSCYYDSNSWEPRDSVKGDVARMVFYMDVRYDSGDGYTLDMVDYVSSSAPNLGKLSTLLQWHSDDPPDDFERDRNDTIYGYQNNRNPFIDHPEYVGYIWEGETPVLGAPVASSATNIGSASFTANWSSAAGSTGYYLDVSTNSGFSSFVTGYNDLDVSNVTTYAVAGLSAETDYYYQVRAYTASDTSSNSNTIFLTTSAIPSGGTETFANFSETSSSYNDGTFTGLDGSTWDYDSCRGDQQITGETPCMGKDQSPVGKVESGTIGGGCGVLNFDYKRAFTTSLDLDIYVNATLVTTISGGDGSNQNSGDITVNISGDFIFKFEQNAAGGQASIDNVSWSNYSSGSAPSAPTATSATGITTSGFTANWNTSATATSYRLDVATDNNFTAILGSYNDLTVASTSQSVTGLYSSTDYYYRVRAVNGYGTSSNSNTISVTTNAAGGGDEIIITELCDNDSGGYMTAYMEIFNKSASVLNLTNYTIQRWQSGSYDGYTYTIPTGSTVAANKSIIITRGADLAEFEAAWSIDLSANSTSFVQGTDNLYFTTGRGYKLYSNVKAAVDSTNDVSSNSRESRNEDKTWVSSSPSSGDPGTTEFDDGMLPVTLSSFTATYQNSTAKLNWITQTEQSNSHWNVYRSISENFGQSQKINSEIIEGSGTTFIPTEYEFVDDSVNNEFSTFYYWLESVSISSFSELYNPICLDIIDNHDNPKPPELNELFGLFQNYPNPFNPNTSISFKLPESSKATISIFSLKGQKITELFNEFAEANKIYTLFWDAKDRKGNQLSSGVYLYKLKYGSSSQNRKMLLIK